MVHLLEMNKKADSGCRPFLIEIKEDTQNISDLKSSLSKYLTKAFDRNVDIGPGKVLKTLCQK